MRCLIYCPDRGTEWVRRLFSDAEPYMLRIGNKPLLEFFIEFCALNGIKEIYISCERPSHDIENYFENGSKWDVSLNYLTFDQGSHLEKVLEARKKLFRADSLLVFNGFFFLQYKKAHLEADFLPRRQSWQNLTGEGAGLLFLRQVRDYKPGKTLEYFDGKHFLQAKKLDTVKAYFELNMEMVAGAARNYIMPSYSNEKGVFIGQNVEIMYGCEIIKPIILGDNIQLKRHSRIGPGAIIGSNSLVDSDTSVSNTVIYRNSYIGTKLEVDNKIIYKRRLINPDSGHVIDIADDALLAEIHNDTVPFFANWLVEVILVCLLFAVQLPFYLLLRPRLHGSYRKTAVWKDKSGSAELLLNRFVFRHSWRADKLFVKLSLHKFHLLPLCLTRKLRLVGSIPRPATPEALQNIRELANYYPAVFSLSDMNGCDYDDENCQVYELFYARHATLRLNLGIFVKTLIVNFFGMTHAQKD
ncbi:MAG: NDP-sugar synthase [Victivallaceae bacterium]|nr:NDP-sugar synthase [Victivallaceae bacterium]